MDKLGTSQVLEIGKIWKQWCAYGTVCGAYLEVFKICSALSVKIFVENEHQRAV